MKLTPHSPGVDHYNFVGPPGGDDLDYLFYMWYVSLPVHETAQSAQYIVVVDSLCHRSMICQGVVITPPDPYATQEGRRETRDVLRTMIGPGMTMENWSDDKLRGDFPIVLRTPTPEPTDAPRLGP